MCAVQKVAHSHVRVVLPFGFKYHRGTRKTGPYVSRRSCQVICRFSSTTRARINRGILLAVPFDACVPHLDIEVSFRGYGVTLGKFIKATSYYHFPALESLFLIFPHGPPNRKSQPHFSGDLINQIYDLRLRRFTLCGGSVAFVSGLLLSATALNDLTLRVLSTNSAVFDPSGGSVLLACLRGTQYLRSLHLTIEFDFRDFPSQHSTFNSQRYRPIITVNLNQNCKRSSLNSKMREMLTLMIRVRLIEYQDRCQLSEAHQPTLQTTPDGWSSYLA
jgi:hypothetical protein